MKKRLFRSKKSRILGGVCGGIAEYFDVDPTLIRLAWILFSLAYGSGIIAYIIAWIIIPEKPSERKKKKKK
jgi:phage shock protein C